MRWLRDGDANSKLFHSVANGRKARNFIPVVRVDNVLISDQHGKEDAFFQAYMNLLGTIENREAEFDLSALGLRTLDLSDLDNLFSEDEVWAVIKELPKDRSPGPDGFIGSFYQSAWRWIKADVMAAIHKLYVGDGRGFSKLNRALITLIPKRSDALDIGDFRPISLIHSFAKLFAKLLAVRLRPKMNALISLNQSAFIKGRNLHDNFLLVRQLARKINKGREAGVLLKLDISRAFDSVSWPFLFQVLGQLGFSDRWLHMLAILFRTATTEVVVNGVPGKRICHVRGLRQGDPLSPLLFVCGMEVLSVAVTKLSELNLLENIRGCNHLQRISLYTDDVVLFAKPKVGDMVVIREMLRLFGDASGLRVNYSKSSATLIHGDARDAQLVSDTLRC
jgi:hypothetical protein